MMFFEKHMNLVIKKIDRTLSVILSVMVGVLATGVILTVFMRYFFALSYGWFEEFLTMLFVSITFMGSAVCIREKQHISISILVEKFTGIPQLVSTVFIEVVYIAVSVFMLVYSSRWIGAVGSTLSPSSGVPFGYYYSIVPISSVISILYASINILGVFVPIDDPITGYFTDDEILEDIPEALL